MKHHRSLCRENSLLQSSEKNLYNDILIKIISTFSTEWQLRSLNLAAEKEN
jgi:hypothetical protein